MEEVTVTQWVEDAWMHGGDTAIHVHEALSALSCERTQEFSKKLLLFKIAFCLVSQQNLI